MNGRTDKNGLTEEEFLLRYNPDKYPKPSLTADIVIFRAFAESAKEPEVLLVERKGHPYLGYWALPGGFAEQGEALEETAARELFEETSLSSSTLCLIGVYSRPGRDPRGWVVSAAYGSIVPADQVCAKAGDDAAAVSWVPVSSALQMELAFDHAQILQDACRKLLQK